MSSSTLFSRTFKIPHEHITHQGKCVKEPNDLIFVPPLNAFERRADHAVFHRPALTSFAELVSEDRKHVRPITVQRHCFEQPSGDSNSKREFVAESNHLDRFTLGVVRVVVPSSTMPSSEEAHVSRNGEQQATALRGH